MLRTKKKTVNRDDRGRGTKRKPRGVKGKKPGAAFKALVARIGAIVDAACPGCNPPKGWRV